MAGNRPMGMFSMLLISLAHLEISWPARAAHRPAKNTSELRSRWLPSHIDRAQNLRLITCMRHYRKRVEWRTVHVDSSTQGQPCPEEKILFCLNQISVDIVTRETHCPVINGSIYCAVPELKRGLLPDRLDPKWNGCIASHPPTCTYTIAHARTIHVYKNQRRFHDLVTKCSSKPGRPG